MGARVYKRSFSGGEIAPEMFGQIEDSKFQTGVAKMLNVIAMPQGPAQSRPGLKYVNEVKDSTKVTVIIPFTFSTTQTMVLEFGEGYLRFHTNGATLSPGTPAAYSAFTAYVPGDLVESGGTNYYCIANTTGNAPPNATYWYEMPTGILEIPTPYQEADLYDLHYVQSADVLTIVHPNYAPRELRRNGATDWVLSTISFNSAIDAPTGLSTTASPGASLDITAITQANPMVISVESGPDLIEGDSVYVSGVGGMVELTDGFYLINDVSTLAVQLKQLEGGEILDSSAWTAYTSGGSIQFANQTSELSNTYVVTAVAENGIDESIASATTSATNNLYVTGSYNTISWGSVSGAARYNVYKLQSGLYGYIGQTESTSFVDDNIAPDMSISPPTVETVYNTTDLYPGAVSYFEQRRAFAGSNNEPQTIRMTRSGTESDMSYSLPIKDNDRLSFTVAARESNTIRHIVPLTELILLTNSAEWRVTSVNSDALTPSSISVRPQSYIGASNVQPVIINNILVFNTARGGRIRELGYSWEQRSYVTGDLSVRAFHLFDNYTIKQLAYAKAPHPIVWAISSNGKLLGLTYMPEQAVGAWHQHDTDGEFESCCVVAEGDEDVLYVVVKREVDGNTVRYVEQMQTRQLSLNTDGTAILSSAFCVDSGLTYDGTNTSVTTMTMTGGTDWVKDEDITCTASTAEFAYPATTDVGDAIILYDSAGDPYEFEIISTSSTTVATVRIKNASVPVALQATATTDWGFARDTITGLDHLEGKTVSILGDGAVFPQKTVSSGSITLEQPVVIAHVGLQYNADIVTLPLTLQIEAFGQGRLKNVNELFLRVFQSSGIFAGPSFEKLKEYKQRTTELYGNAPDLKTEEISLNLTPSWVNQGGQVYIRQSDPLPLTILGMTVDCAIGG